MNLTTKDYEMAQDLLNDLSNINAESLPELTVAAEDLARVRGLIQKKLSDFKRVIEGAENHLNEFEFEKYHNEILKSFLIILKNYDIRIHELFDVWSKYHKHEMQLMTDLDSVLPD
ncbi:MAG: hypothetical protein JRC56_05540 [Deltaproteobacteria bacterium]|nr:hypothetical protein [Deltaproteobacteria bacterium]